MVRIFVNSICVSVHRNMLRDFESKGIENSKWHLFTGQSLNENDQQQFSWTLIGIGEKTALPLRFCVIRWRYENDLFKRIFSLGERMSHHHIEETFNPWIEWLVPDKCFADEIMLNIQNSSYPCKLYLLHIHISQTHGCLMLTHFTKVRSIHGILTNE